MRAVLQRVKSASVTVDGQVVSKIGPGLLCLIGVGKDDVAADAEYICRKILNIRLWPNLENRERAFDSNCVDNGYELLLVSQFTLFGRLKGNKLDFSRAMSPLTAKDQYQQFVERVRAAYEGDRVKDGVFGAMMDVELINDGPVTINIDSQER